MAEFQRDVAELDPLVAAGLNVELANRLELFERQRRQRVDQPVAAVGAFFFQPLDRAVGSFIDQPRFVVVSPRVAERERHDLTGGVCRSHGTFPRAF